MITDKTVKNHIAALLQAGSDSVVPDGEPKNTRVVKRWKLALRAKDWGAVLRGISESKVIDGWYITRISRGSKKLGTKHWQYNWEYSLWYFRSYRDGTDLSNSEDEVGALIESVAEQFELTPDLGIEEIEVDGMQTHIENHGELQVKNIDIIDQKVHIVQASLNVQLVKQPA